MKTILALCLTASALMAQTSELSPTNEGAYQVRIECRENSNLELCEQVEGPQKMVVMGTRQSGIAVIVSRINLPIELYMIPHVTFDPTTNKYTGKGVSGAGMPVELSLELDNGQVLGWVRDVRFQNDLRITGKRVANTAALYMEKSVPPVQVGDVIGVYYGQTSNGLQLKMNLQRSLTGGPNDVFASVLRNNLVYTYFPEGEIDSLNGIVNLYAPLDFGVQNKWSLKFKADETKRTLNGYGLLARKGEVIEISLTRSEGP